MFIESFRHLIEIEALKRENQQNLLQISSENKRISDLEERRKKNLTQIEELKIEDKNLKLQEKQNQIEDLQIKHGKLNSQLALSQTQKEQLAFEAQINLVKNEIEKCETLYFLDLEKSEEIQSTIKNNEEFLVGSLSSLEEIKKEVTENVARENSIIDNRNKRIESLMELCHPSVKSLYLELEKKFAPKNAVSFLIDKKCSACHMMADAILKNSLEEGRSIETCPHCGRFLIPDSARVF